MANLSALASNAQDIIYLSASGTGAIDDPFVSHFTVEGIDLVATEDTLQAVKIKLDTLPVVANRVSVTTELDQPLTDTQLRLAPIEVVVAAGTDSIGSISNTDFNAIQSGSWDVSVNNLPTSFEIVDPIPVTGSVEISNDIDSPITISGNVIANTGLTQPLTDTQLRASSVDTNITNASIAVTGAFYPATQPVSLTTLPSLATGSNEIGYISNTSFEVSNFPSTQAITASSLPLPTGAASETTLNSVNAKLPSNLTVASTRLLVDGSGVTQPVSGTVTANTGLVQPLTNTELRASPVSVTLAGGTDSIGSISNTSFNVGNFPSTQAITATALPLPTGAATSEKQNTGNTSLNNIDTKTPALGQALADASVPVVLTAAQVTTLTPPTSVGIIGTPTVNIGTAPTIAVTGSFYQATQPVSVASLPLPTNAATSVKQPSLGTPGTASSDVITVQGITSMTPLKVDGSSFIQPISGTVTANIGTVGTLATATKQDSIITALSNVTLSAEAGYLTYRNTALSNTAQLVKNTGGSVGGWNFINVNTTPVYVKFFNLSSVTVGISLVTLTIMVPPGDGTTPGMFFLKPDIVPVEIFSTAISVACVTGLADSSTTAPSTAIHVSVRYK